MGIDYNAVLVFGWRISYDQAHAIYDYVKSQETSQENLDDSNIRDFSITDDWKVKGYAQGYEEDDEYLVYYIVYKEWRNLYGLNYYGHLLSEITPPSDEEMMRLTTILSQATIPPNIEGSRQTTTSLISTVSRDTIRLFAQLHVW